MQFSCLLIVLSIVVGNLQAARILSIFGVPIGSQYAFVEPLLKELARRGHHITSITNYPQHQKLEHFRDIVVEQNIHLFDEFCNFTVDSIDANYYQIVDEIYKRAFQMCVNILDDPVVVRDIMHNRTYDLIILDVFFSESLYGLSEYLQAPIVGVSNYGAIGAVDGLVGNISPLSYIPDIILTIKEMNFWQRLLNVAIYCVEWLHYYYKYMPVQKQIYEAYFPNATLTFEGAQKNFALVLVNDHFSLTQARPYVPNMIGVAGLNIVSNPAPLTADIKQLLDDARPGVILVALDVDFNVAKVFLKQFKQLPELIIWQSSTYIAHKPLNVVVDESFNLPSIMGHSNVKLFVSSSNILRVVESVYHGLPMLGLSATGKDTDCIDYVKKTGIGLSLNLPTISDKKLAKAFHDLLSTNYYANIAKTLSLRFRDQQNSPLERAVYWLEYVLRHNGAVHLRNRGQNLTWWQFYNVDVLAVFFCLITLVICLALFFLKLVIELICNIHACRNVTTVKEKKA